MSDLSIKTRLSMFAKGLYRNGNERSAEKLQKIVSEMDNGWISVDDRLPEYDDRIIMCTESGDRFSGTGKVLIGNLNAPEPSIGRVTRYTHWQLMPPAPTK